MAKFFLSTILFFFVALRGDAAANDVSDEFYRLRDVDNKTLLDKGFNCIEQIKYDSALVYFYAVANRYYAGKYSQADIPSIIKAFQDIGVIYMTYDYDYAKSYDYLLQAKELSEENHSYDCLPNIYNCIANILQVSKQSGNAKEEREVETMLKKAFYMAVRVKRYDTMTLVLNNLIALGIEKERNDLNIEKEIALFNKICAHAGAGQDKQTQMVSKAYQAYRRGDSNAAIALLERLAHVKDNTPLAYRGVLANRGLIAKIYVNTRQYDKAIATIKESLAIARDNKSLDYESSLYGDLSQVYGKQGDSVMADRYELLYLRANEKLSSEGKLSSVRNVTFMRELNKANEQVKALSAKRRMQSILLACAIVVMCIIATLLYRLYRANCKIRQNNRHLYRTNVELLANESEAQRQRKEAETLINQLQERLHEKQERAIPTSVMEVEDRSSMADGQQRPKYQNSRMTAEETRELYSAILKVMETSDEIFRQRFTIDRLSELVHSRSRYVSQAINQKSGSNFNALLNEYRIKEACRRLNGNPDYANMTIEGIAESVGFKSRTSFGALFKSMTGLSPSAYQRMAKERNE